MLNQSVASSIRIAVLMTCHNRKQTTLVSLAALFNQQSHRHRFVLETLLVDDGCTDGTVEAVQQQYPAVRIIQGSGHLFWNGGMRTAIATALQSDYDYHLWLNDDTILHPQALETLLSTVEQLTTMGSSHSIVTGTTRDPLSQLLTSGGFRLKWPRFLMRFDLLQPLDVPLQCDTFSGNCVLIPRSVYRTLGNLHPNFTHFMGDLDYGLRAQRIGVSTWVAPNVLGTSPQHHGRGNEACALVSLGDVLKKLTHPKGLCWGDNLYQRLLPIGEWTFFLQEHVGCLWPIPWLLTYQKLLGLIIKRWLSKQSHQI
jgi:GT2 family glycosyltransferase